MGTGTQSPSCRVCVASPKPVDPPVVFPPRRARAVIESETAVIHSLRAELAFADVLLVDGKVDQALAVLATVAATLDHSAHYLRRTIWSVRHPNRNYPAQTPEAED